jgi:hypothetical protein
MSAEDGTYGLYGQRLSDITSRSIRAILHIRTVRNLPYIYPHVCTYEDIKYSVAVDGSPGDRAIDAHSLDPARLWRLMRP